MEFVQKHHGSFLLCVALCRLGNNSGLHSHNLHNRSLQLRLNNRVLASHPIFKTHLILLFHLRQRLPIFFFFQFLYSPPKACMHFSSIPYLSRASLLPPWLYLLSSTNHEAAHCADLSNPCHFLFYLLFIAQNVKMEQYLLTTQVFFLLSLIHISCNSPFHCHHSQNSTVLCHLTLPSHSPSAACRLLNAFPLLSVSWKIVGICVRNC